MTLLETLRELKKETRPSTLEKLDDGTYLLTEDKRYHDAVEALIEQYELEPHK